MGRLERLLESGSEGVESRGSLGLLGVASLGSLKLEGSSTGNLSGLNSLLLESEGGVGVGVELLHKSTVLEGVLLGLVVETGGSSHISEFGLNGVRVDNSGEVSASEHVAVELVSSLLNTLDSVGTEDVVEAFESFLGEDDESSEVTTRGELEEVESVHIAGVNTGEVAGSSLEEGVLVSVDKEGSLLDLEASVSEFTDTVSGALAEAGAVEIIIDIEVVKDGEEGLGALNVEGVEDKGELGDGVNSVTSGLNEGGDGGGGKSSSDGVSLLVLVNLSVPFSPGLERGEHARLSAHVTEGSLSGSVGTGTTNSGNTGNSATSSPGLGGVLLSSHPENSMGLSSVLGHVGVNELDGIVSDGGGENGGHGDVAHNFSILGVNTHNGAGGHLSFKQISNNN